MKISIATLSKRQNDVLDALKRNEKISISHNGQVVAVLQPPETGGKRERMFGTPAFGMWEDRDDMADPQRMEAEPPQKASRQSLPSNRKR